MEDTATGAVPQAPQMNLVQRIIGIYFEPTKTFEDISRKRSWLGMFLLLCVISLASNYTLQWRMGPSLMATKSFDMTKPFLKKFLSEEQLAQMEAQAEQRALQPKSFWGKYSPILLTPIGVYVTYFILAAILLLAFVIIGAGINLRKSFTGVIWGMGPPAIVLVLLSVLFMFIKDPTDLEVNPASNVISNLGMLVDSATHPVMNSLFSSIDLFSLWTITLLAIGYAALSEKKLSAKKAAVPIVILWALWVLIKLGFWAVVS